MLPLYFRLFFSCFASSFFILLQHSLNPCLSLSIFTKYCAYLLLSCVWETVLSLSYKPTRGELINSSLKAVFNYSVKWSVNGQSEIYYIILYISKLSASQPKILSLQSPRSYRITDIWNCMRRHKQHLISSCLLTYHCLGLILQLGHGFTPI